MDLWIVVILAVLAGGILWGIGGLLQTLSASDRLAATMPNLNFKGLMSVAPVVCSADDKTSRLADYYCAWAYRPTFPAQTVYDFISADAITSLLSAGVRGMELDIYEEAGVPIVAIQSTEYQFRQSMNAVPLSDVLTAIASGAFATATSPGSTDPFILSLNVHSTDTTVWNAVASEVKDKLAAFLLGLEYVHQSQNLAQTPLCSLLGKVIIVSGGAHKNTDLDELVNLSWNGSTLRRLTYSQAAETHDIDELTDFCRQNICMVVPDPSPSNANKSADVPMAYGCQWCLMSYASRDAGLAAYIEKFQVSSFVEKPASLRYKPAVYPAPKSQDPAVSFAPITVKTSVYSATI